MRAAGLPINARRTRAHHTHPPALQARRIRYGLATGIQVTRGADGIIHSAACLT